MHVGKRLFPYPVLNNNELYSQFKAGHFSLDYTEYTTESDFVLDNLLCRLESNYLSSLINDGFAEVVCVIECPGTMFRKSYSIEANKFNKIIIPLSDLNGKYSISAYIVAKKDFTYDSSEFFDDYEGYGFQIEKNDILAVDDGFVNTISFNQDDDTKQSSIFVVIKDNNIKDETMNVEYDQDKITICLPEQQWNYYEKMKRMSKFQDMYFSIMAVPALGYCLSDIRSNKETSIDDLRIEYKWFSVFCEAYKKTHDKELDDEDFFVKNINVYTEAQLVLGAPITKAIDGLFGLTMGFGGVDDVD